MPKVIIPDHSQIFVDAFVEMLTEVIVHYDVVDTANPTRMLGPLINLQVWSAQ